MSKRKSKSPQTVDQHVKELECYLQKRGPVDENGPTPERIAQSGGQKLRVNVLRNQSGLPTADFNWRVSPIIDELEKRGTIDNHDWQVATRYMRHYVGSHGKGPATAKFLPYYDKGFQQMEPNERAISFGQEIRRARRAVHEILHPALDWLEIACADEQPLWMLGEKYYPHLSKSQQSAKASVILHFAIGMLASHYGMDHRWTASDIENTILRMRYERVDIEISTVSRKKIA